MQPFDRKTKRRTDEPDDFTFESSAPFIPARTAGILHNQDQDATRHTHLAPSPMIRRHFAVTLLQASQDSPTLARLSELTQDSSARLKAIEPLIPAALRPAIKAGPIEGSVWCLLLSNNAAAAKIRQLLPALEAHLRVKGWDVSAIRLKVQVTPRY